MPGIVPTHTAGPLRCIGQLGNNTGTQKIIKIKKSPPDILGAFALLKNTCF